MGANSITKRFFLYNNFFAKAKNTFKFRTEGDIGDVPFFKGAAPNIHTHATRANFLYTILPPRELEIIL